MSNSISVGPAESEQQDSILYVDFSSRITMKAATGIAHELQDHQRPLRRNEQAIVQCETFRCLAIAKGNGKWVDLKGNALPDVREVVYRF